MNIKKYLFPLFLGIILLLTCQSPPNTQEIAKEYYNLANGYYNLGESQKALEYYLLALNYDSKLSSARFNLCYTYIELKDYESAEKQVRRLDKDNPENDEIKILFAYVLSLKGKVEEAEEIYNDILDNAPENIAALNNLSVLYWEQKELDKAIAGFEKILQYDETNLHAYYNLGELYVSSEEYQKGLDKLLVYLEKSPEDPNAHLWLARGYRGVEEYSKALAAYDQSLLLNKNQGQAWFEKAEILLLKVLDPQKGLIAFEQALSLNYKDKKAIKKLLNTPDILEADALKDIVEKHKIDLDAADEEAPTEAEAPPEVLKPNN